MRDAMVNVVERGTATRMQIPGVLVAGKTGTAQLGTDPPKSHAWIIGFAPADNPRVAVAVVVLNQERSERVDRRPRRRADRKSGDGDDPRCTRSAFYRSVGWLDMSQSDATVLNQRYELQRRVGRGGMADVFLARDQLLDRPVALKVLFPEFAQDPAFVERFRREAQAAANLNHPNIVSVYDWGEAAGTYYIVMEYIDGRSLADVLRTEGRVRPDRAIDATIAVALALASAHTSGVIHRDIKPANILITRDGQVKVADFGIARALNTAHEQDLTQAGSVMGTASYFSPEQAQGHALDAAQRPLLARHRALRDAHREAAVHGREPGRDRVQAGARGSRCRRARSCRRRRRVSRASRCSCSRRTPPIATRTAAT